MTLLIFSGWVLVCDGAADIVFYIIMKLGLRKIAKKAETEKEDSGADSADAVNETADMDVPNDTRTQDENAPSEQQSGKETEYPNRKLQQKTTAAMPAQDADGYSADRKETEESTEPEEEAKAEAEKSGATFKEDAGRGWRKVVASPKPVDIKEINTIRTLLNDGQVVVAAGGGGIPVVERSRW